MMKIKPEIIVFAFILAILPFLFWGEVYIIHVLIISMIFGVVVSCWDLSIGYAGLFHIGQLLFFALGAYTSAILSIHLEIPSWIGVIAAGFAAFIFSIIIGMPCIRVRGIYLLFLTFALQFVAIGMILNYSKWTGGVTGLLVGPIMLGNLIFDQFHVVESYYLCLCIFILSIILLKNVVESNIGLALTSLRDSEKYAVTRGVNAFKYKMLAFAIGSFPTGVIGGFYTHYTGLVSDTILAFSFNILFLAILILGGRGTLYGPLIASFFLTFLNESLRGTFELYRTIIYSAIVVLILMFFPKGMMEIIKNAKLIFQELIMPERSQAIKNK
jgi:branched-chain amino acid transport system permease protein